MSVGGPPPQVVQHLAGLGCLGQQPGSWGKLELKGLVACWLCQVLSEG